ncbi:1,2-phenylacetyl-CoA epoxidase subunit PaaD [Sulfoacidibacillus thermotolerans]|uniref:1,2-phenylacetyl-CoA epoxidase subunit PaaD n=1 Tax=Sulfoacidibacillus thermotolerans TaxID=1765684 RepID=UPI001FE71301|nr:1,2-phenylacetyl-CoA epoxidase subunit PaaD [Sulfoacidibacillus thermotolerans]
MSRNFTFASSSKEASDGSDVFLQRVISALAEVKDPEMPMVSLAELGMIYDVDHQQGHVTVKLLPTFVGCPALQLMRTQVESRLVGIEGVASVDVQFVMDESWTTDRITEEGRKKILEFGIAPPSAEFAPHKAPSCSYCGSTNTEVVSMFGPSACRAIYYCKTCNQPFEGMKFV